MPKYTLWLAVVMTTLVVMMAVGCAPVSPQPADLGEGQTTQEAASTQVAQEEDAQEPGTQEPGAQETEEAFVMRDLAVELSNPLELVYGPDDYLWLTERSGGQITRVNPADGSAHVAVEIADVYQSASQDGVLGMALHPQLLQDTGNDYVYVAYTYAAGGSGRQTVRNVKIVRYTYDAATETLGEPLEIMVGLPGSGDHNSGKLLIGQDEKLYYTIGEQGNNQFGNACLPILAQVLPTEAEVSASDWSNYPGKVLRLNLDGSIPEDNPTIEGVQSHIFTYGHRNVQGIVMSGEGLLYATEQGPKSDDEINLLEAGKNYGWPHVAGYPDDQAYVYANWSEAENCAQLAYSDFEIPAGIPQQLESEWSHPDFTPPLVTFGTVPDDYDFQIEACAPQEWICWPTIAPTGADLYVAQENGVPGWSTSLLVTALKTGTVYRVELGADGTSLSAEPLAYFETTNRYRDVVVGPDGRTFYVITDSANWTLGPDGIPTNELENPGTILEFRYSGSN